MKIHRLEKVCLYDESSSEMLDIGEVAEYLKGKLGKIQFEVRGNPFTFCTEKTVHYAEELASIRIQDPSRKTELRQDLLLGEISFEERRILGKTKAFGVLYDGFELQRVFSSLIVREEFSLQTIHIIFTNRLFATWNENDKRYHVRTSVYGIPSIISTTGLVEAPAKPMEYYFLKQQYEVLGKDLPELSKKFTLSFIDYNDGRLTEVTKGYAMQAIFYHLVGNPFCEHTGCRLYNAHWQEELIFAQLGSGYEFCEHHTKVLDGLRGK